MNSIDAEVIDIEPGFAWVRPAGRASACGVCASKGSCSSAAALSAGDDSSGRERLLKLPNAIGAKPGDRVVVVAADGVIWRAAGRAYMLPLGFAIGTAMLAMALTGKEWLALLGLLGGLAAGFGGLRFRRSSCNSADEVLSIRFGDTRPILKGPIQWKNDRHS